jgi:hypothetical protein
VMSGGASPSTTFLAASSAASVCSTSVCDLTLPMCVLRCFVSLALSSWSVILGLCVGDCCMRLGRLCNFVLCLCRMSYLLGWRGVPMYFPF